jgi:hypothetical protein
MGARARSDSVHAVHPHPPVPLRRHVTEGASGRVGAYLHPLFGMVG